MTSVTQRLALLSGKYNMRNPAETSASVRCPRRWRPAAGTIDCTRAQQFFLFLLLFYSFVRALISDNILYYIYTWHYGINQRRVRETTHAKPDPAILLATDDLLKSSSNRRNRRGQRRRVHLLYSLVVKTHIK